MNELGFWLITFLILVASSALFILPMLFGKESDEQASRDELNKAFFHDRVAEVKKEAQEGLIEEQNEITIELQQSLLDDIPKQQNGLQRKSTHFVTLIPGILLLFALSYGLYFKMGSYEKVVNWQSVFARLPDLSRLLNTGEPLTDQEMQDLMLALRTQLTKTPDEPMGWLLLGRLGLANRDVLTTEGAMEKAYQLDPKNPEIQLGYSQSMMLSGEETRIAKAKQILEELVSKESDELDDDLKVQAFSLLAFDAFEQRDFESAIAIWSKMQTLLAKDDPRQEMLSRSIERAKKAADPNIETKKVRVTINIDSSLVLAPTGTLVVSVYDEFNSPMPVAAKLLPLGTFPMEVVLTDADSMLQERLLSSLPKVIIKARIDTDNDVMTKKGDWGGETQAVNLGEMATIMINQKI